MFYGNLAQAYFSSRYAYEREELSQKIRSKNCALVGAGIGPYTVYLCKRGIKVTQYELNPKARYYNNVNMGLNQVVSPCKSRYRGKKYQSIVSMIPNAPFEKHHHYNFEKECVIYHLCYASEVEAKLKVLERIYGKKFQSKCVRGYSKSLKVFRFYHSSTGNQD